jgi:hypothetical protein
VDAPRRRTAAAAGAYVGAWLVGLALAPAAPAPDAAAADIARHYLDNAPAVLASSALVHGAAGVALAVFATSLAQSVRAHGGLRRAVIGTGIAASILSLRRSPSPLPRPPSPTPTEKARRTCFTPSTWSTS